MSTIYQVIRMILDAGRKEKSKMKKYDRPAFLCESIIPDTAISSGARYSCYACSDEGDSTKSGGIAGQYSWVQEISWECGEFETATHISQCSPVPSTKIE